MDSISRKLLWMACLLLVFKSGWSAPTDEDDYANDDNYANDEDEDSNGEEAYTGPPPEIVTRGQVIDVEQGHDVLLPCDVRHTDNFAVIWTHDKTTIWLDNSKMSQDKRLRRFGNNTIAIHHAQANDSGSYSCRIETNPIIEIIHTVNVVAPAMIVKRIPEESTKEIRKGEALTLACEAIGSPVPTVTWTRKGGKAFLNGNHKMTGTSLTFENVDRHYAGVYQCTAENKQSKDTATFDIRVHYAPEIDIAEETVTTHVALEPEITCTVHADPAPKVSWYRNGQALQSGGRLNVSKIGNKHTLLIKGMEKGDFGSYTCHAANALGTAKRTIILSGAPSRPMVKVAYSNGQQLPELKWSVESHLPVHNYELRYQTLDSEEKTVEASVSEREGNIYSGVAVLSDIVPGESEVTVRARNDYGWSHPANFKVTSGVSADPSSGVRPTVVIYTMVAVSSIAKLLV